MVCSDFRSNDVNNKITPVSLDVEGKTNQILATSDFWICSFGSSGISLEAQKIMVFSKSSGALKSYYPIKKGEIEDLSIVELKDGRRAILCGLGV